MKLMNNLLVTSVLVALVITVIPILPYKYQIDKCELAYGVTPDVCARTYIPFEEGFPFKFYFSYGPGFAFYPYLEFLGNNIKLTNCQDTACEPSINPLIPFVLDLIVLSTLSYVILFSFSKLKSNS